MSTVDILLDLFRADDAQGDEESSDESGEASGDEANAQLEAEGVSPEEFLEAMPDVCAQLPPEQAQVLRAAYGIESPEGAPGISDEVAGQIPPVPEDATTAELMEHYATVINVSHSIEEAGDTIYIDQSVRQNIDAYGDVNQSFDMDAVAGEGAVQAGDGSQVNTADGAVQAGGDVSDSTVATGNVQGSVTGDNEGSTVGDGNAVISGSDVGSASFGSGDATSVAAENANMGDGTIASDTSGDLALNEGDGNMTSVEGSNVSESSFGEGGVTSNDSQLSAEGGSSLSFGEGSTSSTSDSTTSLDGNSGTAQVGDDGDQTGGLDDSLSGSFNTDGSFNAATSGTDNSLDGSFNTDGSLNTTEDNSDHSIDDSSSFQSDDDVEHTDNSFSDDDAGTDADALGTGMFGG